MKTILILAVVALVVAFGVMLFGAGPRRVIRRRVVEPPVEVRRRVVTEEIRETEE